MNAPSLHENLDPDGLQFDLDLALKVPTGRTRDKLRGAEKHAPKNNADEPPRASPPPSLEKMSIQVNGMSLVAEPPDSPSNLHTSTLAKPLGNFPGYLNDLKSFVSGTGTVSDGNSYGIIDHSISLGQDPSPEKPAPRMSDPPGDCSDSGTDPLDFAQDTDTEETNRIEAEEELINGEGRESEKVGPGIICNVWGKRISERRRQRQGDFSKWADEKAKEINLLHEMEQKNGIEEEEGRMSWKSMAQSHQKIIADPREYQLELFEIAKSRNTIAVLDTGSGKTLIACLLIRHIVEQELESRAIGNHPRVSFFLVHNVTLVFQQAAVLRCNIDANVGEYCGDMGAGAWKKETWGRVLEERQVIVMTADILYSCLVHAFIKMKDINLLCFDEAHHAKKRHSFARIIKDFYQDEPEETRPKIFGMTASPVGSREDVVQAAADLEKLLHSQIATTSDLALLQGSISRPDEAVAAYPKLKPKFKTELCEKLYASYGKLDCFTKIFAFAEAASSELGPWCADITWKFALTEAQTRKFERRTERKLEAQPDILSIERIEAEILHLQEAAEVVRNHEILPPYPNEEYLSMKVLLLHAFLSEVYSEKTVDKCIIFVSRRFTATVLGELFKQLEIKHLRLGILIGAKSSNTDQTVTFREQMITVSKFRQGRLNCLIATSVAEEGLDIPDCSLVVRFDLYHTMIQYIQSRGRARRSLSRYIHMVEIGNNVHLDMLSDVRKSEEIMREFCHSLPADRLLDLDRSDKSPVLDDCEGVSYVEPTTGAKLTMTSSMPILSRYTERLPQEEDELLCPLFTIRPTSGGFVSEVTLPILSPVHHVEGVTARTKMGAKRSAAFMACIELRKRGELDENLMPKSKPRRTLKMANAQLALDIHKTNIYPRRVKPEFWKIDKNKPLLELWVNILLLSKPDSMASDIQPICIITRDKLPRIPSFTLYSDKGAESELVMLRLSKSLLVSPEVLKKLCDFTSRLFLDLFNKTFELNLDTVPYWIAPIKGGDFTEDTFPHQTLDWELLDQVSSVTHILWEDNYPVESLVGRFLIDRRQRSRRFIVLGHDRNLKPTDPYPTAYVSAPGTIDIRDYSYNAGQRRKWSRVAWAIPESEPVLIAERVLHRINYLSAPDSRWVTKENQGAICPSAFSISVIPSRVIRMAMIFPATITRIDSYLHARDVCRLLGMEIDLGVALEAITKDSDNSHEHSAPQMGLQKGMGNNYERLEFLGDCFLKLATSLGLYIGHHADDEFELHVKRMMIICNKYLFEKALEVNMPEYIQTQGFSRRSWYPEMRLLEGKGAGKETSPNDIVSHSLADKSISDVCEALIGAALVDSGLDGATYTVTSILRTPEHTQKAWGDYSKGYTKPVYQVVPPSAAQIRLAGDIEGLVGYKFRYPRLLTSAFTHPSLPYSWDKIPSYQRLEFLGDAILDLVCVRYIFEKYPDADPQWLTEHKMAMVSNKFLGMVAVEMGFHRKLRRIGASLDNSIRDYEIDIKDAKENSNGAADFWTSVKPPPKALPDVLEAFLGAVFVDSDFDYGTVERLINVFILPYFVDMTIYDNFAVQHPATHITKRMVDLQCESWGFESQQCTTGNLTYILTAIVVHREIFSYGHGKNIKAARIEASLEAIQKLEDPEGLAQLKGYCNCAEVREKRIGEMEKTNKASPIRKGAGKFVV